MPSPIVFPTHSTAAPPDRMLSNLPNRLSFLRILLSPVFFFLFVSGNPLLRQLSLVVFLIAAAAPTLLQDESHQTAPAAETSSPASDPLDLDPVAEGWSGRA